LADTKLLEDTAKFFLALVTAGPRNVETPTKVENPEVEQWTEADSLPPNEEDEDNK
jgi:hypothetical protein